MLSLVLKLMNFIWRALVNRIAPLVIQGTILTIKATLIALAASWVGWKTATYRITDEWMKRWAMAGGPSALDPYVRIVAYVGAFFFIMFGWMFWAMFTASALNTMLRHLAGIWFNF